MRRLLWISLAIFTAVLFILVQRAFVELELKAGKDMTLPRGKGWMTGFIERELPRNEAGGQGSVSGPCLG